MAAATMTMIDGDPYQKLKAVQQQLDFLSIREGYIREEMSNLKREMIRAREEVKRVQSVPLIIGTFAELVDKDHAIVQSNSSTYYVRVLSREGRRYSRGLGNGGSPSRVPQIAGTTRVFVGRVPARSQVPPTPHTHTQTVQLEWGGPPPCSDTRSVHVPREGVDTNASFLLVIINSSSTGTTRLCRATPAPTTCGF